MGITARDHLAWTIGDGDPMHRCRSHTVYLAHRNSKSEARGRCGHKNNRKSSKKSARKERGQEGMSPRQGLTIELPEGCEYPYHRSN